MKRTKYAVIAALVAAALGLAIHRGYTQQMYPGFGRNVPGLGPAIVGPGNAPNVGTAPDPLGMSYYGGYYGPNFDEMAITRPSNLYNVSFGANDIPQTSNSVTTKLTGNNVTVQWSGEPRAISSITVRLLDKYNSTLAREVITKMPAKATLKRTSKTTGYSVTIEYINGMSNTIISPL